MAGPRTRRARSRPTGPAPGRQPRPRAPPGALRRPPTARRAGCRRFRRRPCPGPGRATGRTGRVEDPGQHGAAGPGTTADSGHPSGLPWAERPGDRAERAGDRADRAWEWAERGRPGRPGQAAGREPARPGPRRPDPAGQARRARAPRTPREVSGRPRRARRAALAHRVLAHRVPAPRARVLRVPARGRVTTRSARPRPAWARRPRPGPRVPFPASRVVPASRRATARVPGVLAARVPHAAQAAPAAPAVPGSDRRSASRRAPAEPHEHAVPAGAVRRGPRRPRRRRPRRAGSRSWYPPRWRRRRWRPWRGHGPARWRRAGRRGRSASCRGWRRPASSGRRSRAQRHPGRLRASRRASVPGPEVEEAAASRVRQHAGADHRRRAGPVAATARWSG